MALPRAKFRETVFLILYSEEMGGTQEESIVSFVCKELSVAKSKVREAWERAKRVFSMSEEIDGTIDRHSRDYEQSRIPSAERNILRLGVYELLFDEEIPPKVAIDEAVRLTRKFSSPEAASFVNAVLDQVYQANKAKVGACETRESQIPQ